jgi:hypothetical protein
VRRYASGACDAATLVEAAPTLFGRGEFQVSAAALNAGVCTVRVAGRVNGAVRTIEAGITGGGGAIAFNDNNFSSTNGSRTVQWNHRVNAPDPFLVVGVSFRRNPASQVVTLVTYDGQPLTFAAAATQGNTRVELWYKAALPTGNNRQIRVTLDGNNTAIVAGAVSLTGANQVAAPITAFNAGNSNNASVTVTPDAGDAWIIDTLSKVNDNSANVGAGQLERWNRATGGGTRIRGAGSTRGPVSPVAPVTMSWTLNSSQDWATGAVAVRPAGASQVVTWREIIN